MKHTIIMASIFLSFIAGYCLKPDNSREISKSYFRIGEQATMVACHKQELLQHALDHKYPNGVFTNEQDFEAASNPLDAVDDPRIFAVLRSLNCGGILGLDINDWFDPMHMHLWTTLKD